MWETFSRCLPIFPVTELWQVLAGKLAGRTDDAMVTVFDSVGFALENFAALRFMLDAALSLGLGQKIALVPNLSDPKSLFGHLSEQSNWLKVKRPQPLLLF